jgi:hypothetical protein
MSEVRCQKSKVHDQRSDHAERTKRSHFHFPTVWFVLLPAAVSRQSALCMTTNYRAVTYLTGHRILSAISFW